MDRGPKIERSELSKAGNMGAIIPYLHIFDDAVTSGVMACGDLRRWVRIWNDVGDYAAFRVRHCK
jgi:hypothetical protein